MPVSPNVPIGLPVKCSICRGEMGFSLILKGKELEKEGRESSAILAVVGQGMC